jgi:TRAP-type mannitol/chloroaromatic compound transport system permease small subunit
VGASVSDQTYQPSASTLGWRTFSWAATILTFVFLLNNFLTFWFGWPGATSIIDGGDAKGWIQAGLYGAGLLAAIWYVRSSRQVPLRADANRLYSITAYLIRWAFFTVLLVGLADAFISFLRVEGMLENVVGSQLTADLGRPHFRGAWVHVPLMLVSFIVAAFTRTLGFIWLTLLVVVAELIIVFTRFIFSYEQAYMGDLVRFWYAALFLFASAYTLIEEGHVRVDVLYAGFSDRAKGLVNHTGSILLGMALCFAILWFGMEGKASVINAPLLNFEVSQSGFGMYTKYMMAGFLAVFAVSMMIQFSGYLLDGLADRRGEPGKRVIADAGGH